MRPRGGLNQGPEPRSEERVHGAQYQKLGNTGPRGVTGRVRHGAPEELFGPIDEQSAIRLVDEALDLGITYIDTSRYYGSAEERLGKALTPAKRAGIVLSTRVGRYGVESFDYSRTGVRRGIEESLRLLRTDYVDILLLHDVVFVDLAQPFGEGYEELQLVRQDGLCRFIGVSGYPLQTIRRALNELPMDVALTYAKGRAWTTRSGRSSCRAPGGGGSAWSTWRRWRSASCRTSRRGSRRDTRQRPPSRCGGRHAKHLRLAWGKTSAVAD